MSTELASLEGLDCSRGNIHLNTPTASQVNYHTLWHHVRHRGQTGHRSHSHKHIRQDHRDQSQRRTTNRCALPVHTRRFTHTLRRIGRRIPTTPRILRRRHKRRHVHSYPTRRHAFLARKEQQSVRRRSVNELTRHTPTRSLAQTNSPDYGTPIRAIPG